MTSGTDRWSQANQRLGIRHLLHAHPAKTAIHHVRSHFSFQPFITPVAHLFQDQHAQGHFRRGLHTPSYSTLRMPLALRLLYGIPPRLIHMVRAAIGSVTGLWVGRVGICVLCARKSLAGSANCEPIGEPFEETVHLRL